MAYAYDLVLFGSSKQDVEVKVSELVTIMNKICLKFKPAKFGYYSLSDSAEIWIYSEYIPTVDENHLYTYLSVSFGMQNGHTIKEYLDKKIKDFTVIAESKLHPLQEISSFKRFIHLYYAFLLKIELSIRCIFLAKLE